MKTKNIKQWTILPCIPDKAYNAWLDSKTHGQMIEREAKIDPNIGGSFSIWDGAVKGKTIELDPKKTSNSAGLERLLLETNTGLFSKLD